MESEGPIRDHYTHLNDSQFRTLNRMLSVFGGTALESLLTLDPQVQVQRIDAFRAHERHVAEGTSHDTSAAAAVEIDHLRSTLKQEHEAIVERMRQGHIAEIARVRDDKPKPIKLDVTLFEGKDGENLLRWFLEVEVALEAALVKDDPLKVAFAMSFLKKRSVVHEWAYTTLLENRSVFPSWETFKEKLYIFHQGKHMAHNHRARFLACKQEKRTVYAYIQSIRQLSASVEQMDETTKVTVLMEGLNIGPVRTQLFRINPPSFAEACRIALEEDNSYKRSGFKRTPAGEGGATPMDLGALDMDRPRTIRCYNCNLMGHMSKDCRKPRRKDDGRSSTSRGKDRGRARRGGHSGNGKARS